MRAFVPCFPCFSVVPYLKSTRVDVGSDATDDDGFVFERLPIGRRPVSLLLRRHDEHRQSHGDEQGDARPRQVHREAEPNNGSDGDRRRPAPSLVINGRLEHLDTDDDAPSCAQKQTH